ncbi:MAG: Gx transporter family protein [Ruminococcaceae bacterium]|nr:Gx transporter family protein [Oscillospiraceae bacterium]
MKYGARRIAHISIAVSVAMILSYIEFLLPPVWSAVPGIKLGLANIIIIFAIYRYGSGNAAIISGLRIFLSALLFGSIMTLLYSAAGALLSLCGMMIVKKTGLFSTVGVSIVGGVLHNVGQILMAVILLRTAEIGYYMIVLAITGTLAGIAVGIAAASLIKHIPPDRNFLAPKKTDKIE